MIATTIRIWPINNLVGVMEASPRPLQAGWFMPMSFRDLEPGL
jgi:hypothetical protein